jgi:hypothetical protein
MVGSVSLFLIYKIQIGALFLLSYLVITYQPVNPSSNLSWLLEDSEY